MRHMEKGLTDWIQNFAGLSWKNRWKLFKITFRSQYLVSVQ